MFFEYVGIFLNMVIGLKALSSYFAHLSILVKLNPYHYIASFLIFLVKPKIFFNLPMERMRVPQFETLAHFSYCLT